MGPDEDTQREWVFTLYNFDNSDMVNQEVRFFLSCTLFKCIIVSALPVHSVYMCVCVCVLQDINSLMHSMYEVLEASVKPPYGGPTPLKIKLVVTPSADPENILQIGENTFNILLVVDLSFCFFSQMP